MKKMFKNIKRWRQKKRRLLSFQLRKQEAEYKKEEEEHQKPKVWAFNANEYYSIWSKIVSSERPMNDKYSHSPKVIGPWRSEMDCEEWCDRENRANFSSVVNFYSPQNVVVKKTKAR